MLLLLLFTVTVTLDLSVIADAVVADVLAAISVNAGVACVADAVITYC